MLDSAYSSATCFYSHIILWLVYTSTVSEENIYLDPICTLLVSIVLH